MKGLFFPVNSASWPNGAGYYLSSPSWANGNDEYMLYVGPYNMGQAMFMTEYASCCFRPVVHLNVNMVKNETTGIWEKQ